jgi:hypothetical protein
LGEKFFRLQAVVCPSGMKSANNEEIGTFKCPFTKKLLYPSDHYIFLKYIQLFEEAQSKNIKLPEDQMNIISQMNREKIQNFLEGIDNLEDREIGHSAQLCLSLNMLFQSMNLSLYAIHQHPLGCIKNTEKNQFSTTSSNADIVIVDTKRRIIGIIECKKEEVDKTKWQLLQYYVLTHHRNEYSSVGMGMIWSTSNSMFSIYGILLNHNENMESRYRYCILGNFSIEYEKGMLSLISLCNTWKYMSELPSKEIVGHLPFDCPQPLPNMFHLTSLNENVIEFSWNEEGTDKKIMKIMDYYERNVSKDQRRYPHKDIIDTIGCLSNVECIYQSENITFLLYDKIEGTCIPANINAMIDACNIMKKLQEKEIIHGDIRKNNFIFKEERAFLLDYDWSFQRTENHLQENPMYVIGFVGQESISERHVEARGGNKMKKEHDWYSFAQICKDWLEENPSIDSLVQSINKGDFETAKQILLMQNHKIREDHTKKTDGSFIISKKTGSPRKG